MPDADVVDINSRKPHLSGPTHCLGCGAKWVAVGPVGVVNGLECPECHALKGIRTGFVMPPSLWTCVCGCELFYIEEDCTVRCPNCGSIPSCL